MDHLKLEKYNFHSISSQHLHFLSYSTRCLNFSWWKMSIKLLKLHFQYLLFNLKCSRQVTIWLVDRQLLGNVQSNQATEAVNRSNCSNPLYFLLLSLLLIYFLLLNFFFYFSSFIFSPFYTHRNNDNSSSSSYFFTRVPVVGSV